MMRKETKMKIYIFVQYPGGVRLEIPGLKKEETQVGHNFSGEGDFNIEFALTWGSTKVDEGEHAAVPGRYRVWVNGVELPYPKTRTLRVDGLEAIDCGKPSSWELGEVGKEIFEGRRQYSNDT